MRFVIQSVTDASVTCESGKKDSIGKGYVVLIGISDEDNEETADRMLSKLTAMRIMKDSEGKTNLSLRDVGGSLLMISQFTLYADMRRGNRPSFAKAGAPDHASRLYDYIVMKAREAGFEVGTGVFGDHMKVTLTNDGPFTIILDSDELLKPRSLS